MASHSKLSAEDLHMLPFTGSADDIQPSPIRDEVAKKFTGKSEEEPSCGGIICRTDNHHVGMIPNKVTIYTIFKGNPDYKLAILTFFSEWDKLGPIEKRKLRGKTLQLSLSIELQYLNESINHNAGVGVYGMLNGGSKRRTTPLYNISHPLPKNEVWKLVNLHGGFGKKEKQYTQGWTLMNEPLWNLYQKAIICYEEYRSRTNSAFLRKVGTSIEAEGCLLEL
ncbi:hypothetical protein K2173_012458 [Erythroxylum novogranatense]|uniref:LAGLIDADG homing endonuclease n=1 Tax=Erythroxylum novogranatense TaxID=1862640 RepID=A0AAV8SLH8_9ROSI|nr:hypothetical protein K2173_012458 [Erythroxylum novogranatense]